MKKRVLVICAQERDYRELSFHKNDYDIIFHELNNFNLHYCLKNADEFNDPIEVVNSLIKEYKNENINAVISSSDYPGIILASILAKEFGLNAPEIEPTILCQHKYYSRVLQSKIIPECVPNFHFLENENHLGYPFFVKPVKSSFSVSSHAIHGPHDLKDILTINPLPKNFIGSFEKFVKTYTQIDHPVDKFVAEEFLSGHQVTVEGFSYKSKIYFLGIVDSNFYPNTMCFESFTYPSKLPLEVQNRIKKFSEKFVEYINLDNGFFNIEFIYDDKNDKIYLLEINPRIAAQFADLYEKVDGTNAYKILLQVALNEEPQLLTKNGKYEAAGSFVLRNFKDSIVRKIPLELERQRAKNLCPEMRLEVYAKPQTKLSDFPQDGKSFRYAVYNIGAKSKDKLKEVADEIKKILNFQFL